LSGSKNSVDINRLITALQECAAKLTSNLGVSYDRDALL
jgi:hypothetical protein